MTLDAEALALLTDYLDLPKPERAAWLQANCGDNTQLRHAVLRLAQTDTASGNFLETSPLQAIVPDLTGKRIGRYQLLGELGRGGMGAVYRARRADGAFEQDVAIKLFLHDAIGDAALQRFNVERQILASIEHPGIARLIDGGITEDGTPYVVMELIDGEPITHFCDHQELNLEARLKLFQSVCQALDAAHLKGVVHRDIKPANVMATRDGQTRLVDFGIAKVLHSEGFATALPATLPGLIALTPEYASPEQVRGQAVGVASDIYSLGILLYELVTGSRPYAIQTLTPVEIEHTVCDTLPPDPSTRVAQMRATVPAGLPDRRKLRRALRGDLDRIVMTALRKLPEQRYRSAAVFAADIERYLHGLPVKARGASKLYRASKFVGRHRVVIGATVFAFLALFAGLIAVSMQAREAQRQRDMALQEANRALIAKDFLVEMIGRADPYENAESATLIGAIKQSIPGIEKRFAGQPALESDMRYAIGFALQNLGEVEPAREQLDQALALREAQGSSLDVAEVLSALGIVQWWKSDFKQGEERFQRALQMIGDDASKRAVVLRIDALTNLAGMLIDAGDYRRSEQISQKALAVAGDSDDIAAATRASVWGNLATAQESLKEFDAAAISFDRTLNLQRQATGEMHPGFAVVLNNQAHLYFAMGKQEQAIANLQQSLRIRRKTLGENHPQVATALFNLAHVQISAGDFEAAERNALEALKIAENSYGAAHPRSGKAHEALAELYVETGQPARAREQALLAKNIYASANGVDPAWIKSTDDILAKLDPASVP